jgi:cytochrome bd-type quinol oxidase subunit 2
MNGILSYSAPRTRSPKAMTYGIVSAAIATLVCALPSAINGAAAVVQAIFAHPKGMFCPADLGALMVLVPTLAMITLPLLGILFAGMSVAANRRDYECAMIGVIVNISGLIAGVGAAMFH